MRPPPSLDPRSVAGKIAGAQHERQMKLAAIDAEMEAVVARMEAKKGWSRAEERKEEEEAAAMAKARAEREEAEREEALQRREAAAKARAAEAAKKMREEREAREAQEAAAWAVKDQALAAKLGALVSEVEAAADRPAGSPPPKDTGRMLEDGGGPLAGLFGNFMGGSPNGGGGSTGSRTGRSPTVDGGRRPGLEDELAALVQQHKEATERVQELRATGGAALAAAVSEVKELKPKLRKLELEARRADRLADAKMSRAKGTPVMGSPASIVSARRLERQRARMEARGGGMMF